MKAMFACSVTVHRPGLRGSVSFPSVPSHQWPSVSLAAMPARRITVSVQDGTVTLSGAVHSWADRNAVERIAGTSPGVRTVDDRLVVDPYA